ncbi:MAG TPA: N-acetylmuramoyl-L-alanine amidase [Porphyromonadaceae bacterium]|nr:N-acetylmuramoyl-L-alanine amidase [Porphyromonadaceae bacterium]
MRIVIDPGHGGRDPGAVGPAGIREKDVTLAVAKLLAGYLKPIAETKLTRDSDRALGSDVNSDLRARVEAAETWRADYFISIHCNAAAAGARGVETYAYKPGGEGERLARAIQKGLVEATGLPNRGVKFANYYVLRKTSMPAVLVEMGFISNPQEEKLLRDATWQDKAAKAIATGIANYLGKKLPAPTPAAPVTGYPTVPVNVHGKLITGIIIENRTFVWINDIASAYGDKTRWEPKERKVYVE